MLDVIDLVFLPDHELARLDIGAVQLAGAVGLPWFDPAEIGPSLQRLDSYAQAARAYTERVAYQFQRRAAAFDHSFAVFRAMTMVTVLQRDLGISYRRDTLELDNETFFKDPDNLFIQAPLHGRGGTCASLPVLYAAVGRRLGYPLKLVHGVQHQFARWDDPKTGERFNIECTSVGFLSHPDSYYKTWPFPATDEAIKACKRLESLTPRQELASFLGQRGTCLESQGNLSTAAQVHAIANELFPQSASTEAALLNALDKWDRQLTARMMVGFPSMTIQSARRFNSVRQDLEQELDYMTAVEAILDDPRHDRMLWQPLREGKPALWPVPAHICVRMPQECGGCIDVDFLDSPPPGFDTVARRRPPLGVANV